MIHDGETELPYPEVDYVWITFAMRSNNSGGVLLSCPACVTPWDYAHLVDFCVIQDAPLDGPSLVGLRRASLMFLY